MTKSKDSVSGQSPHYRSGITSSLFSAVLFGAATPAAKMLLDSIDPLVLAGLFYLGSGLVMLLWLALKRFFMGEGRQSGLALNDLGLLSLAVLFGGILGPMLLFAGLSSTPASTASLLLNLESVFTALVALFVFREHLGKRLILGMALIVAGCVVIGWREGGPGGYGGVFGPLAIALACLAWAADNNVTRKISGGDAITIGAVKCLAAGAITLSIGLVAGKTMPGWKVAALAALVGSMCYGQSIIFFVRALRDLGTARTSAYFSIAPFVGVAISVLFLGEAVTMATVAGGTLAALGVWLHLTEDHSHEHAHPETAHNHLHADDFHHEHGHGDEDHHHPHEHSLTIHSHPHYPDIHHRHGH